MKIKVGVFFGGKSVEHEISIISAIQAIGYFDREKYDIIPIYITKDNKMYVGEALDKIEEYRDIKKLLEKSQRVVLVRNDERVDLVKYPLKKFGNPIYDYIDIAFPIVHGTNVEDGTLQGYLKMLDLPYVGCDVLSSAVGMNKYVMKAILKDNNIPVLDCVVFTLKQYNEGVGSVCDAIEAQIMYPVIVKPIDLGSSIGIKKASNREELEEAIDYAFEFATQILVERSITNLMEINCSVLGDYEEAISSECEEPISTDEILSYEDKYVANGKNEGSKGMATLKRKLPADISEELKDAIGYLAVTTFKVLSCNGVARIDFMIDKDTGDIFVNEINTIPGSLSFYLWNATGVQYSEQLDKMIQLALKREREQKGVSYSLDTNILSGVTLGGVKGTKGV